jgi:hypothetical protein
MVIIYSASNGFNAHIIKGLLEQFNIPTYIHGEYLQGGIGELPSTADLVKVLVDEQHQVEAKKIIKEWEESPIIEEEYFYSLNHDLQQSQDER